MERVVRGMTFELPVENAVMDKYIEELAGKYETNMPKIIECMMGDPGAAELFLGMDGEEIMKKLGMPTIRLWKEADGCEITYIVWEGDDMRALSVECGGVYESFAYGPTVND